MTNQNHYKSSTTVPVATKVDRMVTNLKGHLPIESNVPLITSSCKVTGQTKNISTTTEPMGAKLGRLLTYVKGLHLIKFYGPGAM